MGKISIVTVAATLLLLLLVALFSKDAFAEPYSRYKLVEQSTTGNNKLCVYKNTLGKVKTLSIGKGQHCPFVYK